MVTLDDWNPLTLYFKYKELRAEVRAIDSFLIKELQVPNIEAAEYQDRLKDWWHGKNEEN